MLDASPIHKRSNSGLKNKTRQNHWRVRSCETGQRTSDQLAGGACRANVRGANDAP